MKRPLFPQEVLPAAPDREQLARDEALEKLRSELAAKAVLRGRLITGERDSSSPTGLSDGISFTAAAPKVIDHGLGEECGGWIEIALADQSGRPDLMPSHTAGIDTTKQLRVTPTNTARCWLLVFPKRLR